LKKRRDDDGLYVVAVDDRKVDEAGDGTGAEPAIRTSHRTGRRWRLWDRRMGRSTFSMRTRSLQWSRQDRAARDEVVSGSFDEDARLDRLGRRRGFYFAALKRPRAFYLLNAVREAAEQVTHPDDVVAEWVLCSKELQPVAYSRGETNWGRGNL